MKIALIIKMQNCKFKAFVFAFVFSTVSVKLNGWLFCSLPLSFSAVSSPMPSQAPIAVGNFVHAYLTVFNATTQITWSSAI